MSKDKKRNRTLNVVMAIAAVVFLTCVIGIGVTAFSYLEGQNKYDNIEKIANIDPVSIESSLQNDTTEELEKIHVDWEALRSVNPDIVAWVVIPNTPISYPVVQGSDNNEYLYKDFDGDQGWLAQYGCVFMDYANNPDWSDQSYFIYGHHMIDGSMFAYLSAFQRQEDFDNARDVYLLTPKGNFKLRSICLYHCAPNDPIVYQNFNDKKDMKAYLQDKIDNASAKADDIPDLDSINRLFAFSTCDDYSSGRYTLYTYPVATSAKGLNGDIGIESHEDGTHFVENIATE